MKAISQILRVGGYLALIPFCAHILRAPYGSCFHVSIGLFDILMPAITFVLIIAYGNSRDTKEAVILRPWFWILNILFYSSFPSFVLWHNRESKWESVSSLLKHSLLDAHRAILPEYQKYDGFTINALGDLVIVVVIIWMPAAALLSVAALRLALKKPRDEPASQVL